MIFRISVKAGMAVLLMSLAAMIVGHLDAPGLDWMRNQVSTYAVRAPRHDWITASLYLSAAAFLLISISAFRHPQFSKSLSGQLGGLLFGAASAGVVVLAHYEETAATLAQLKQATFGAVRQQSFHDAGLMIFFYAAVFAMVLFGAMVFAQRRGWGRKIAGGLIALAGPISFLGMTTSWPKLLGIVDSPVGLKQRAGLLVLWLGAFLLMILLMRKESLWTDRELGGAFDEQDATRVDPRRSR
ncbi:MAG: hypothetical protein A2X56_13550 [Nitrospirae bacterium GWC2_57_13]|jgi:hypothetical protein|nr:MAG: hypothetical protein A2X56_13550 [Nitrospirae bacterium GWC2_57_13]OGW46755.1 MAG: hypothetical protein A2X57_05860 [Nitrospirae bacterium GWD2_57_8]HAR46599.1 hypothetical protein [Nitrospiraceae bacterium]HAS53660.1 hypothetical protein [Nitrospiraceae bacterium]